VRVPENKGAPLTRQEDALGKELIGYGSESFEPIDTDFGNQPKRTWSDYTNKYSLIGRLKSLTKNSSVNLNNDEQKFSVKYSRLSNADMKYIDTEKLRISRMNKDDKEWDDIQGKRREAYGDDYVDRNYTFDEKNIREWTDSSGRYNTQARLYSTLKNDVTLVTDKDKKITLPLSKLSAKDIDYVDRMIQYKRRDIKMDKFEAEYNASTGAPGWGYDDAGRPTRKEDYKAPDKIGGYQFDPVTGRVMGGSGNFGPRPTRTFKIEDGRATPISSPSQPLPKFASGIKPAVITDANREAVISRARVALAQNKKRNEITKTSQYYAEKLGFDPSITEADLYNKLDKLRAQPNPIQPINNQPPGLPGDGLPVKPNIGSPTVKPPVSAASPTVKPPVSAGKYPKADGTRTDELAEADQSIFTTQDLITQANETNRVYVLAAQIARYRLAVQQGIDYKTGLPLKAKQKPVTKQHGGLINYLADGGILTSGGSSILFQNGKTVSPVNDPDLTPMEAIDRSIKAIRDFPPGAPTKPVGILFDLFDAVSDTFIGISRLGGGLMGKSISNYSKLGGDSAFSDTLDQDSTTEIHRGLARLQSAGLNIAKIFDDTTGYKIFTPALEKNAELQDDLYKDKIASASANGVKWGVVALDGASSVLSSVAGGEASTGGIKALKELALNRTAGTRSALLLDQQLNNLEKAIGVVDSMAGKPKDAAELLNNTYAITSGKYDGKTERRSKSAQSSIQSVPPLDPWAVTHYNSGGQVAYASNGQLINFQPKGTDTVPAMLTPGEFVINKKSTSKHLDLLRSINSGAYSHGDIVKQFNRGGSVLPNYYMTGNKVQNSSSYNNFNFGQFMQKLTGQISSAITESIKRTQTDPGNQQNVSQRSNGVSIDSKVFDSIGTLSIKLQNIVDGLAKLNIPSQITLTGKHDINVIINGDSVLNKLKPEMQDIVMKALKDGFQKLTNVNNPLPSDKLINPFDIQGPTQL
jgi:hypothetical protein